MNIILKEVDFPKLDTPKQVLLSQSTIEERFEKIKISMREHGFDYLLIYCDLEHGTNFEYLTGFVTRFEESLLVISKEKNYFIAGNENLNKAAISRCAVEGIHYASFSLPSQPNDSTSTLAEIFQNVGMKDSSVGIVGWKLLSEDCFDVPHWIVKEIESITNRIKNATNLFVDPKIGVRITNNANEIVHYEYGASLASLGILKAMEAIREGISEVELGTLLNNHGQRNSVVSIAACGKRFENAQIYPTQKRVKLKDPISLTVAYKGGLQSRTGYAVSNTKDLDEKYQDYLEKISIPYYRALVTWLQNIQVGIKGNKMYELIESVLPKSKYHWSLNPGHLCADEEWLSSPIYKNSDITLQSGMIFQFDIIPSLSGYAGASCEGGICLANAELRNKIKSDYPEKYKIFEERKKYIKEILGIHVSDDVLFMGNADMFYRPLFFSKKAFVVESK